MGSATSAIDGLRSTTRKRGVGLRGIHAESRQRGGVQNVENLFRGFLVRQLVGCNRDGNSQQNQYERDQDAAHEASPLKMDHPQAYVRLAQEVNPRSP